MTSDLKFWFTPDRSQSLISEEHDVKDDVSSKNSGKNVGELESGTLAAAAEEASGGMGCHLGVFSCTLLIVGRTLGTGIFSTPSSILGSVGSVKASLILWALDACISFCGLFVWLEYGTMVPRSGGEKVYLEAVYKLPRYLVTTMFAMNAFFFSLSPPSMP